MGQRIGDTDESFRNQTLFVGQVQRLGQCRMSLSCLLSIPVFVTCVFSFGSYCWLRSFIASLVVLSVASGVMLREKPSHEDSRFFS